MPYDGKYVSNKDIRDEGVATSDASDVQCDIAIKAAESYIESRCNRWFYKADNLTLVLDGGDHYFPFFGFVETTDLLQFSVPIIQLTGASISGVVQDLNSMIVFTRIGPPRDDRWNPRIISKLHFWPKQGVQNISLTGSFGFCEYDGSTYSTPESIRIAARKLAIRYLPIFKMTDDERDAVKNADYVNTEQLPGGGYQYEFGKQFESLLRDYTGDSEIDGIIEFYRYKRFVVAV